MNDKKTKGTVYENKAVLFLQEKGYKILEQNYTCRYGEIDIVAKDGNYIVFVEVKYRNANAYRGASLEAVTAKKQQKIKHTARVYLYKKHYNIDTPVRFDVCGFEGEKLTHIENAF